MLLGHAPLTASLGVGYLFKLSQFICIDWASRWSSELLEFHSPIQIRYPMWYPLKYQEVNEDRNVNYSCS